ncbi:uncharacterized protein LOC127875283 [Dreissena polymorpha]|uniref:Domain of unknown function DB domain-containing protein n=1 Tax=Dreissena polymorpha TaxID=45954 RepID=A0A9D4R4A8_DREPO|nr:uncharacterized protein LOC127875283 [Dreissena polymorpha]KAH3853412.1 hypothetical protein DPMN_095935 [Dreissena polymorpha]
MLLTIILVVGFADCQAAFLTCFHPRTRSLVSYDNEIYMCAEGIVVPKTTTIPTTTLLSSHTAAPQPSNAILPPFLKRMCELDKDLPEGYKCCGYIPFQPDFQTCCGITMTKTVVHSGKPDKDYTCCRENISRAFTRNDLPCLYHPATNDKFWNAPRVTKLWKSKRLMQEACRTNTAYFGKVEFFNKTSIMNSDLNIRLNELDFKSPTSQIQQTVVSLYIEKDRHSPKPSKLDGKYFLIVTERKQPTETPPYINVKNDAVYKLAKSRKRAWKKIRQLVKQCNRLRGAK